jgi:fluoride exporter
MEKIKVIYTLLIFIGAGFGGIFRYWVSNLAYIVFGRQFPYGTLIVNVSGCFLMGFCFIIILERFAEIGPLLRSFLLIGFLGGYTTFSSFSIETMNLFENGDWLGAVMNILLSTVLCITATWLGIIGGKQL